MKKKLLALALSSASTAVMADVSLYGRVAVGIEQDHFQNTTVPGTGSVQDFGSYFGIRGSDPVYGQTAAIWQVEQFLDLTAGQAYYNTTAGGSIAKQNPGGTGRITSEVNTLASSESYLGLQGAWGRFRIGNLSNYMRSSMGSIDVFNYANGVNGLGTWSRTSRLLPDAVRYDSPSWNGFNFAAAYSYNTSGQTGVSGIGSSTNFGGGLNGYYSGGVYSAGIGWKMDNFTARLGTMVFQQVGAYTTGSAGMSIPDAYPNSAQYYNAYANRLELGYNDPDGAIIGVGFQTTSGLGWSSWANSGGSFNNYIVNPGYANNGLNSNQYQTQEAAISLGYHIGPWTPKIGYVYGNNLMYGGNITSVISGSASQIPDSGYQQAVAELDWNITPRTIVFINYGQIWWGGTMQNISYCGLNCGTAQAGQEVNGSNQFLINQASASLGFSHTF
jgi:major outer membrane protein P.IB